MRTRLKYIGLAAAAVLLAAEVAMIPAEADALGLAGGPPTTSTPGPYYNQGDVVNFCVNQVTEQVRAEVHSDVLGNCAANEVQLSVSADPSAVPSP